MSSREQQRLLRGLLGLFALLCAQVVHAHARFLDSVPAADATLESPPQEIVLNFSRVVTPVTVSLVDAGGNQVESVGDMSVRDASVVLPIVKPLSAGNYRVRFRVLSGDAHAISGEFQFTLNAPTPVDTAATANPVSEPPHDPVVAPPPRVSKRPLVSASLVESAIRAVFMALLLLAVGFTIFRFTIRLPDTLDAWLVSTCRRAAAAGSLAAVLYCAVATLSIGGLDAFRMQHLYAVLQSSLGLSLLLALVGFLMVASTRLTWRGAGGAGIALLLISRAVTGHPASQEPAFVLMPGMAVHVATAGFWFASLWVLLRLLQKGPLAEAPRILDDFARIALWSVAALLAAGITMATAHLESFAALLQTEYGVTLLWKLAGVAGLLVFAAINKAALTPRLVKNADDVGTLRASIRLEAALMIVVIAVSTILAATSTATTPDVANRDAERIGPAVLWTDYNRQVVFSEPTGD